MDEDIAAIKSAVLKELDLGNDVVVNAHSWGGIPTCSALDGLSKVERQKAGMSTGVTRLIFAAAFLLPEGVSLQDAIGGRPAWWQVKVSTFVVLDPNFAIGHIDRSTGRPHRTRRPVSYVLPRS